ncbi:putative RNA polymerase sigma factor [Selenomonas ruminantium subsp. lactilytica TAM6421]|uniref:Putative RNA polymerase sigma factor n=1 Tax=Selenomonas ruminantium subsp. lactilytica (strain NBRC 103574 / TAM6421) TaxID=927704 RepID=I0GUJ3_SELRL|nr:sigma-70 family RNA polymerase sigma factor [Selenomonas ruminantium]BAL84430.1 putative RNA polymerase sigma factor [Selenomonas ruminantium subsp. lactilytica TAM6421]
MYSEKDEKELIRRAQKGDNQAVCQLLAAYEGLIKNMSRRYSHTPTGRAIADDAQGILLLAFMEALRDFQPEGPVHFAAFLRSRLHSAIYQAFRTACRYNQRTAHPQTATEDEAGDWYDMIPGTAPSPEHQVTARDELTQICRQLSEAEKRLLSMSCLQGLTQSRIARLLHRSPGTISKQLQKLRAHLQAITGMATACPCT